MITIQNHYVSKKDKNKLDKKNIQKTNKTKKNIKYFYMNFLYELIILIKLNYQKFDFQSKVNLAC